MIIKFYGNDIVYQGIQIQNALKIIIDKKLSFVSCSHQINI